MERNGVLSFSTFATVYYKISYFIWILHFPKTAAGAHYSFKKGGTEERC